jgi:1-acyl-sn-glycerol-3-phosphate acyltransferase
MDRQAWQHFEDLAASGKAVLFFPEGTRSPDGQLQVAKAGSGMLIHRCRGSVVVPIRLFGTEKAMPRGSWWIRPRRVSAVFGPALDLEAEMAMPAGKATFALIADKVMKAIAEIQRPL